MIARHIWTIRETRILRLLYADTLSDTIAAILGLTVGQIYRKAHDMGMGKSPEFRSSPEACRLRRGADHPGKATQFKPGIVPWNKGTHFSAGGRSAETRYKPGNRSGRAAQLWKPIGGDRLSDEGYLQVKLTDTGVTRRDYVAVHHLVWELHRGPVPKGHAVCFRDGNKARIVINNLECIPRRELMLRNSVHRLPQPLAELVQLRGALQHKINRRKRNHEQQHHQ